MAKTPSQIVAKSRAKAIAEGARRIGPLLIKDSAAIAALEHLTRLHGSQRAAIEQALKGSTKNLDIG